MLLCNNFLTKITIIIIIITTNTTGNLIKIIILINLIIFIILFIQFINYNKKNKTNQEINEINCRFYINIFKIFVFLILAFVKKQKGILKFFYDLLQSNSFLLIRRFCENSIK